MTWSRAFALVGFVLVGVGGASTAEASRPPVGALAQLVIGADAGSQKAALDKALSDLDAAVKKAGADDATEKDFEAADTAVKSVDEVLAAGKSLAESDEGYRRYAGDARAQFALAKSRLRKSKKAFAVLLATRRVTEAQTALTEKLGKAEAEEAAAADLDALRGAATALEAAVKEGAALERKDPTYAALANKAKAAAKAATARAESRGFELQVAAHKAKVEGALADATGRVEGLGAESKPSAYSDAEGAVTRLAKLLEEGAPLAAKDAAHRRFLAGVNKGQPDRLATIKQRRLAAAEAAITASLSDLDSATLADLDAASKLIERAEKLAEEDAAFAKTHSGHRRHLAGSKARVAKQRRSVDVRRAAIGIAAHETKLEAAIVAADEALVRLEEEPKPSDFSSADEALKALAKTVEDGAPLGKGDRKYAIKLAGVTRKLTGQKATVVRRRIEVLNAGLTAQFEALPEQPSVSDLEPVEQALAGVETASNEAAPLARSDRALGSSLRTVQANLRNRKKSLAAQKLQAQIRPHRAKVEAAKAKVDGALEALVGKSDHELYVAAEGAVADLKKAVESGAELGAQDRAYRTFLGRLEAAHGDQRALIRQRRIEAAELAVTEKMGALDNEPDAAAFEAAASAVKRLQTVTESNRAYGEKHRGYAGFVRGVDGRVKGYEAKITTRRDQTAVAAQSARVEEAMEEAATKMGALEGTPAASAFEAAEASVASAEKVIESASDVASKSRAHAALLARSKKTVAGHKATITRRRVEVEVAAQRAVVEEKAAAVDTAVEGLEGSPAASAFEAADAALTAYEAAIEAGAEAAKKDRAHAGFLGQARRASAGHRAMVARRRLEVAVAAADAAMEGITEAREGLSDAEGLVGRLETTIEGAPADLRDRRLTVTLAGAKKTAKAHRGKLAALALEAKVAPEREKLEAANKAVTATLEAIAGEPKPSDFGAAEDAVRALAALTESNVELAAESPAYGRQLAAAKRAVPGYKKRIAARRSQVVIAAFKASTEEAEAEAQQKLEAASAEPGPASFKIAEEAADTWGEALAAGEKLAAKDRGVAKWIAASNRRLAALRRQVVAQRGKMQLDAHRAQVEEAQGKVQASLQALGDEAKHEDYQAAETAIADLMKVVDAGDELAAKDPAYARTLAQIRKQKPAQRALIRQRRIEVAEKAAVAGLEGLEGTPDEAGFRDAERMVSRLEKVTDGNADFASKHAPYGRFVAGVRKRILAHRATIDARRLTAAQAEHRAKIDKKEAEVKTRLETIEGEPGPAAFAAAERAIEGLEEEVKAEPPPEASSKAHKAYLAGYKKTVAKYRRTVATSRVALEVAGHRARADEAQAKLDEAMGALDADAPAAAAFSSATDAADALESVVDEGDKTAKKDRAHAKHLAGLRRAVAASKKKIAARRVAVATAQVDALMGALEEAPSEDDVSAAEGAVQRLETLLGKPTKTTKRQRAAIAKRRIELETAPHRAKLEAAQTTANERLEALAEEPKPADFAAATESVEALSAVLEQGAPLAAKSKAYARTLAVAKKKVPALNRRIQARRTQVVLAAWSASVEEAKADVETKVEALEEEGASAGAFAAADEAVGELESTLAKSDKLAAKSKTVKKALAAHTRSVRGYRATIAKRRARVRIAAHRAKVEEAKAAVDTRLEALGEEAKHEDYQAAEEAIHALKQAVESGDELGMMDPSYGKTLAALGRQNISLRATVRRRRVEAAESRAKAAIAGLGAEATSQDYATAYQAVARLESTAQSNASFGDKDPSYKKFTAGVMRRVPGHRARIDGRRVELNQIELEERLAALDDEPGPEAFAAAEEALRKYGQVLGTTGGSKTLVKLRRGLPSKRAHIEKKRVEVAEAAVRAQVAELAEAEDDSAFEAADSGLDRLEETLGEAARVGKEYAPLAKVVAKSRKGATTMRIRVAKARTEFVVRPHREAVQAALAGAREAMAELDDEADAEAFAAVEAKIGEVEVTLGKGEELRSKSKAHGKFMDKSGKAAAGLTRGLARRRAGVRIRAHAAEVEAAETAVVEALEVVESADTPDFDGADKAIEAYAEKVEEGAELASGSKKYRKALAKARRKAPVWRAKVVAARIGRVEADVKEKLAQIEESPTPDGFVAAQEAVSELGGAISEAKPASKRNRALKKTLARLRKSRAGFAARIELARIAAARRVVATQMAEVKSSPSEEAVESAEESLENLSNALKLSKTRAKKSKKLKKALAVARKSIKKDRARLKRAKVAAELAPVREAVTVAAARAAEIMGELGSTPEEDAIRDADTVVGSLGEALTAAAPKARKSKSLKKTIRKQRKLHARYRRTLARVRVHEQVSEHRAKVETARESLETQIAGLDAESEHEDYQDAMTAVSSLGKLIAAGDEFADMDRKYGKYLSKLERRRAAYPRRIREKRVQAVLDAARERVEALGSEPEDSDVVAANRALDRVQTVIDSNSRNAGKKFKRFLAVTKRALWRLRVDASRASVAVALAALEGEPEADSFRIAEETLDSHSALYKRGKKLAKRNRKLKKVVAAMGKDLRKKRGVIQARRLEAALAVANEGIEALREDTSSAAIFDAESAVERLDETVKASKKLAKKSRTLKKRRAVAKRKSKAYKRVIKRVKRGGGVEKKAKKKRRKRRKRRRASAT